MSIFLAILTFFTLSRTLSGTDYDGLLAGVFIQKLKIKRYTAYIIKNSLRNYCTQPHFLLRAHTTLAYSARVSPEMGLG